MRNHCNWIARLIRTAGLTAFVGTICLNSVHADTSDDKPSLDSLLNQVVQQAKGNPYLENHNSAIVQQLAKELKEGQLRTQLMNSTPIELLRGIENTKQGDYILAIDYGIDWEGQDFNPYLRANLEALGRGVTITRIFIVSEKSPKHGLCNVMHRMHQAGITVHVAKLDQLAGRRQYEESKAARVIFHYQKKHAVLMIEVTPLPDLKLGNPYLLDVTWDYRKIEDSIHYIDWLMNSKQSAPFEPATCR